MTTDQLQDLKDKIEKAKTDKAKAEGAIERIEAEWKEKYGCKSAAEVNTKITDLQAQMKKLDEKRDGYMKELEELMGAV